jgi:23S rRNA (adenine1618-N6)-methyltransferase
MTCSCYQPVATIPNIIRIPPPQTSGTDSQTENLCGCHTSQPPTVCHIPLFTMRIPLLLLALCSAHGWISTRQHSMKHFAPLLQQRQRFTTLLLAQHRHSSSTSHQAKKKNKVKGSPIPKHRTHTRNEFQGSYDMENLCKAYEPLLEFIVENPYSTTTKQTIQFDNPHAVRALNAALLATDYQITSWQQHLPMYCLTPPVPGRADYIHHVADILGESKASADADADADSSPVFPTGPLVRGLDIGTGASLIYPLIGTSTYGWSFVATDVSTESLQAAAQIAKANSLDEVIDIRQQKKRTRILAGILEPKEKIDFIMCNPPFYESREAFEQESERKVRNLAVAKSKRGVTTTTSASPENSTTNTTTTGSSNNFGGTASELWYPGGELAFISTMIDESRQIPKQCLWFSSLVSRRDHVPRLQAMLQKAKGAVVVRDTRVVTMGQGRKSSAILFWSFYNREEQKNWCQRRGW